MKKIFILIPALLLFIPIIIGAQIDDSWMNMLNEQITEPQISLQTLELYWSADGYAPFGYGGRVLPTQESFVTVDIDLKISGGNPKSLKYSWFLDGIFQEAKSGFGKDGFKFGIRRTKGTSHTVLLKVFNESRSFLVEKTAIIPVVGPELVIYNKNNSQVSLAYNSSAKSFKVISNQESSFLALPYFFNIKSLKDLEFEWVLGKKSVKE